jgi:predicted PurR-regulated permease PerM
VLFAAVIVALLLYQGRQALSPFVVGLLLVYLLHPVVERLVRLRIPRWIAVLGVYAITIFVVVQGVSFMIRPLVEQIRAVASDLPGLQAQAMELYRSIDMPAALRQSIDEWLAGCGGGGGVDPGMFAPVLDLTAGFLSGIFGYIIIPVWGFYLLKDRPQLTAAFDRALPPSWREDVWEVIRTVERVFGQWVRGQLLLGVSVGIATFIGLEILNFLVDPVFGRFALLLAVSAGILELLPIIGPIIAAVPAVLLAATAGPEAAIAALLLYLIVQQLENNLLVPKIQGDAVELHPSAVMFALVVGGAIAGLTGAILALPVTAAGRNVFRYLFRRLSDREPRNDTERAGGSREADGEPAGRPAVARGAADA